MRRSIIVAIPLVFVTSLSLHAGTVNWQGDVTSDWNTPGNWDTNTVPVNTDDVFITNTGAAPQINGGTFTVATLSLTGATLTLNTGTQLNIATSATINAGATLATQGSGRLILAGSATLTSVGNINGGIQAAASSVVSFNGNGTQTGDVRLEPTASGAIFNGTGVPAIAAAGSLTLEPAVAGTVQTQLNGSLICNGTFNLNGNPAVDTQLNIAVLQVLTINGTMNINAGSNGEGQVLGSGTLSIAGGATLNINGAGNDVPISCATLNTAGNFNVLSGSALLTTNAAHSGLLTIAGGAVLKLAGTTTLTSTGNIVGRLQPAGGAIVAFDGNGTQTGAVRIEPTANDSIIQGNGNPAIATGATLTLEPAVTGSVQTQLSGSFLCDGTFNLNGNSVTDTLLNITSGQLTIDGTMNINAASNGEGQILGVGTLGISLGAILNINGANNDVPITCAALNNAGQINVLSGSTFLSTVATHSGTLSIAPAAAVKLSGSASLASTGDIAGRLQPTTSSLISFNGNATQVSDVRIEPLNVNSIIQGSANPAIAAGATLTVEPAVAGTVPLQLSGSLICDGTFNLNGNSTVDTQLNILSGQTLTINGTMNINAAASGEGQVFGAGSLAISGGPTPATLNINGATNDVPISCAALNNAGKIKVLSGNAFLSTIATHSGTLSVAAGSALRLSGTASLTSTGDISGRLQPTTGSVISFDGNGKQTSAVRVEPLNNDSIIQGSGNPAIANSATLTLEPATTGSIQTKLNGPFICDGTFNLNGNASVDTLLNITSGQFTLNGTMNINAASNGEGQILGAGTLSISGGAILNINGAGNDVPISCAALNNAGQISVLNGNTLLTTIATNSGFISVGLGSALKLAGTATLASTGDISGRLQPTTGSVISFNGNATQVSDIRIEPLNINSVIQGTANPAIAAGATLTLEPAVAGTVPTQLAGPFVCNGTFNLNGNAAVDTQLNILAGQTLTINGTMNINAAASGEGQVIGSGLLAISGGATLNIFGASNDVPISCAALNNAGQINILSGNASLTTIATHSGAMSIVATSVVKLASSTILTSTGDISGRLQPINGSVISFNGNGTQVSAVRIEPLAGGANLSGGGTPAIAATGILTLEPAAGGTIPTNLSGSLICDGTFNLNGNPAVDTRLNILSGQTLTINGTMNINAGSSGEGQVLGAGNLVLSVGATLNANGASNPIPIQCGSFNSGGTVSANSGVVDILTGFTQSAGSTILNGGTVLIGGGTGTANYSGGTLQGNGSFQGNVNNTGATVKPGIAAGTMTISGTYTQGAAGTLEIEIGGATAGSGYDQLAVTGAVSLAGTLRAKLINGFVPAANVQFLQILSAGSRSGTFTTIDALDSAVLRYFVVSYTATAVNLNTRTIPVISGASFTLNQDTPVNGTITLSDPDGDVNNVSVTTNGALGTATITNPATGAFTYVPAAGKFGFDQFTLKSNDGKVDSAPLTITVKILPTLKPVLTIDASQNPLRQNVPMTLTAVGSDPNGLTFSYLWDFADGSAAATDNPVTHTFASGGVFQVQVTADNGLEVFTATLQVTVFSPNSGAAGVVNIATGEPPIVNPLDGISIAVAASDGGVIELAIDVSALNRNAFNISTDFDGLQGRAATRSGSRPVHKFTESGAYVATATVTDKTTGVERGKVRKTLVIGKRETGEPASFTDLPAKPQPEPGTIKGKFLFNSAKPDAVTFNSTIELPAGLDLSQKLTMFVSLGNILDSIQIQSRGKGVLPTQAKRITKAAVRLPRLKMGQTLTTKGLTARVQFTISGVNLSNAGFDTEGVLPQIRTDEAGMKSVPRKIQLGLVVGGAPYEGLFDVDFTLGKNNDSGQISGRKAR